MLKLRLSALIAVLAICCTATLVAFTAPAQALTGAKHRVSTSTNNPHDRYHAYLWIGKQLRIYQNATWKWQFLMGAPKTKTSGGSIWEASLPDLQQALAKWKRNAADAHKAALHPPHENEWWCIHHYEGAWTDTGAPYFGGLQMDWSFMKSYGGWLLRAKGPANNWTPLEQMWVAERAYRAGRGFYPWPNTARDCGLI